jgi:hypothetical protein
MLAVLGTLGGCATLSEDECRMADWRLIGFEDGSRGYPAARLGEHREACAEHDIVPDLEAYRDGRLAGLEQYCRPQNGYSVGVAGGDYAGVCPVDLEAVFVAAYRSGRELHDAKARVDRTEREINAGRREIETLRKDLAEKESELVRDDVPSERRIELLQETKEGYRRIGTLEEELASLRVRLGELEAELARLRAESPYP